MIYLLLLIILIAAIAIVAVVIDRINFPQRSFKSKKVAPGTPRDRTGSHISEE